MPQDVHIVETGPDARVAGARLTIDLRALQANHRALARVVHPARAAGVVKADAYGLGVGPVVGALAAAGCKDFFVALPDEGAAVRAIAPEARIFVLDGLFGRAAAEFYGAHGLIPVLNTPQEAYVWEGFCGSNGESHPCAVNVDTGMNRLGMTVSEAITFADENRLTRALHPVLLMSHLACADDRDNPMNLKQLESFQRVRRAFGDIDSSLVNSAGILLGRPFHLDVTRPGIAVYGGSPARGVAMRTVVTAEARVAQIRRARKGETVSYGGAARLERDTLIAVVAIGYGDGFPRAGSGAGVPLRSATPAGASGFIQGQRVPVLGRITMDLTMFDVTDLGEGAVSVGDWIELFGPNLRIEDAAAAAGTVAYELLTNLGRRYRRSYIGAAES